MTTTEILEFPPKADLRRDVYAPLPVIPPGMVDPTSLTGDAPNKKAQIVLDAFNAALIAKDGQLERLATCFHAEQAHWHDAVALTAHMRSFSGRGLVAAALLETAALRGMKRVEIKGDMKLIEVSPVLKFLDVRTAFKTALPAATCTARLLLVPVKPSAQDSALEWKIWVIDTWMNDLDVHPEDESLLLIPGKLDLNSETIETDVFIIGGGNSGLTIAARLKAIGVESVIAEKNAKVGDSWALRYDCMRFHLPTASCELPYTRFPPELQHPHLVKRDEIAAHTKAFAKQFHLNVLTSAKIISTLYQSTPPKKKYNWKIRLSTPQGVKTIHASQLVQATGIGSRRPNIPSIQDAHLFKGITLHSAEYKSAQDLVATGVKTALVIGSANTAFDLIEDCHNHGLATTMLARSPTYVFPIAYSCNPNALGMFNHTPVEEADRFLFALPQSVEGVLGKGLFRHLAEQEPDRYKPLAAAGFPVIDPLHPDADLQHHLLERAGGHYIDVGTGVNLISSGKVKVIGLKSPVGYNPTGVRLSDGSSVNTDAVIWATGFADHNARDTVAEMLGDDSLLHSFTAYPEEGGGECEVLGPRQIAERLDGTWGVDIEGEIRGCYKRHLRMPDYWVMGGNLQLQRWHSIALARQIKGVLEGMLPEAYRGTPRPVGDVD